VPDTVKCASQCVLALIRLSQATEESTLLERQREVINQWAAAGGNEVVALFGSRSFGWCNL